MLMAGPLPQPDEFLFQGVHQAFRIRIPFRIVKTGKCLVNPQGI